MPCGSYPALDTFTTPSESACSSSSRLWRAKCGDADIGLLRVLHLFHRMSLHHVADLVAQCAGELVEVVRAFDKAAVHVDKTAGQRERVDLLGVHDVEMPIEIAATRLAGDRLAKVLDVSGDCGICD